MRGIGSLSEIAANCGSFARVALRNANEMFFPTRPICTKTNGLLLDTTDRSDKAVNLHAPLRLRGLIHRGVPRSRDRHHVVW